MATNTETLGLIQPETTDFFSVEHFNTNMAVLDADAKADAAIHAEISENLSEIKKNTNEINTDVDTANASLNSISAKIGNSSDSGTTTIFGKLNSSGSSVIKSTQYVSRAFTYTDKTANIAIKTVNPNKCFVTMERLYETTSMRASVTYSLTASSVNVSCDLNNSNMNVTLGFWVVEFV